MSQDHLQIFFFLLPILPALDYTQHVRQAQSVWPAHPSAENFTPLHPFISLTPAHISFLHLNAMCPETRSDPFALALIAPYTLLQRINYLIVLFCIGWINKYLL